IMEDEIATLKLKIDTIKNENQEKEKKYLEDIEIVKQKNDEIQKAIKLNEATLTEMYSGQVNVLRAENAKLRYELKNEKRKKERLEMEVKSYRSRLTRAIRNHQQSQASKKELELALQRAKDECLRLQLKMNSEVSDLTDHNKLLSHQLSEAESKFSSLDVELHHTRDALREKSSVLEHVQRELSQAQCQKKESEHPCQCKQGKLESLEERLSQLESENLLLRQQLGDTQNKIDSKEKMVINIQEQFQSILKNLQDKSEKQGLMLEESIKKLTSECDHLKKRMCQYENKKAEREVSIQREKEFSDLLKEIESNI
uniref:CCDC144C-like coiled-coil domain-containing protein n=1 Tax=Catagonus wagneri TaxID=51154 RepID=A0A8C3WCA8_9CETA